jgi:hypothetical protein
MFPLSSEHVPQHVLIAPHFYTICFDKLLSFFHLYSYPQFISGVLAQVKNDDNEF